MIWMVCRSGMSGKYYDGFYGADCNIHSEEQIFNKDDMPYYLDSSYVYIVVGIGDKPSVMEVQNLLEKHNKQ